MIKPILVMAMAFLCLVLVPVGPAWGVATPAKDASQSLELSVLSSGGMQGTSLLHHHQGTLGQPHPVGVGGSPTAVLWSGFWRAQRRLVVSPVPELPAPLTNRLWPNRPNPFNPRTTITFSLADPADVELAVFDLRGAKVRTLVHQHLPAGVYREIWDGRYENGHQAASGVYLYQLRHGAHTQTAKMLLVK